MWEPLKHHDIQAAAWTTAARFTLLAAGRGSGKTTLARRRCVRFLPVEKPWSDPKYFYGLPTRDQAKRVAWNQLQSLIPRPWIKRVYESDLRIKTIFGSELFVVGMDKPQRIEGDQWDGGVIDEYSDQRPGILDRTIRPALTHRRGWFWGIGVPKRIGIGATEFRETFNKWLALKDPNFAAFTWSSEDILPPEECEQARRQLSEDDYNEQFRGSFISLRGLVFHAFSSIFNVFDGASYSPHLPLIIGQDFNVDPMSWCVGHVVGKELHVFDEIRLQNTNTAATMDELFKRYGHHKKQFVFIGDASGRARKTSATRSDYLIIKQDERFAEKRVLYNRSNPLVVDRNATVNAMLCNANQERRLMIHPRCKFLIRDLESLSYKPGTREVQPTPGLGHMSDSLGYIVHRLFPIALRQSYESSVVS